MCSPTDQPSTQHPAVTLKKLMPAWWLLASLFTANALAVPTEWQWGHPFPHGNQINAVVWGDDEFVAVGEGGNIISSPDGALLDSWVLEKSTTTQTLNDIAWSGTRYVSVGALGTIVSRNSEAWSIRASGTTDKLTTVIWNDTKFLAIGERIATIDDPINGSVNRPAATILTSPDGFSWTLETATLNPDRHSDVPPPRLNGITWDGAQFFASSDDGAILSSKDGIAWYTRSINSIVWDGTSNYLAVGDLGLALTSSDGTSWTLLTTPVSYNLHDVAWGDGRFVVVGENGTIISTADNGATWLTETSGTEETLRSVIYDGLTRLITVGHNGTILTRNQGSSSWAALAASKTDEDLHGIAWNFDILFTYVAVGDNGTFLISNSNDISNWVKPSTPLPEFTTDMLNIRWHLNFFLATGKNGTLLTASSDGNTWTNRTSGINDQWLFDSSWDGTRHIVVGSNGTLITSTSADASVWEAQNAQTSEHLLSVVSDGSSTTLLGGEQLTQIATADITNVATTDLVNGSGRMTEEDLNDILFFNDQFTTVGNAGTVLTSTNGIYWLPPDSITGGSEISNDLFSIAITDADNNQITASGAWGTILQSTDSGANWNSLGPPIPGNADFLRDIASNLLSNPNTPTLVTVGSGGSAFTSINSGASWNSTAGPTQTTEEINGLVAGDSMLVAVGNGGVILNSTNAGLNWASQTSCSTTRLHNIAWQNSVASAAQFVAVGDAGTVCFSDDGIAWATPAIPPDSSSALYGIAWGEDQFIAVGGSFLNSVIYTSPNGENWTLRNSSEPYILRDIAWNKDHFIAVGDGGTITTSPKGITWSRNSSGTTTDLSSIAVSEELTIVAGVAAVTPPASTLLRNAGDNWEGGNGQTLQGFRVNDLAFGGTQFAAVGPSGAIAVSEDGQEWTEISTGTNTLFNAIVWDNSKFIAAGSVGHILYANNRDLVISGDFTVEKVRAGEMARYELSITNRGITTAESANYTEELPAGSTFISATNSRGNCTLGNSLICPLGEMVTGATATITVDILTSETGVLFHTPKLTANGTDSDEANDTINIDLEVTRGNSPSGGAAFSYWSLVGIFLFLLATMRQSYFRQRSPQI